jgi:hypothetical protein
LAEITLPKRQIREFEAQVASIDESMITVRDSQIIHLQEEIA